jgi:spermidine synthase
VSRWLTEDLHPSFRTGFKADKVLYESETGLQKIVVFENADFGRMMMLDGVVQTTEGDEFIYHEMLAHVPILAHGSARRVLIIGGGDGGMIEEVLKHRAVETATMVEIDPGVVDLCRKHLPSISRDAFDDPRADLVFADGVEFVARCEDRYDVVIVDSTDPVGPGEVLFSETFYRNCKRCLAPGGVLVTQNGVPFLQGRELTDTLAAFRKIFADATCYLATVPTYVGGPMAFGWGTDAAELRRTPLDVLRARFREAGMEARYYTPEVHQAAFALPGYIAKLIA